MNERNKGVVLSYIQIITSVIVNLIYVPVLLHFMGKSEYGLYQIAGSFYSYITVFESSISGGVLKYYCKALDLKNDVLANETLYTARRIYRILSLFIALASIVFCTAFYYFYKSSFSQEELNEGTIILFALFINMIITVLGSVYLTIITGHEKFIFIKGINILIQVIQPFLVILFVMHVPYAIVIVLVMASLNACAILARYFYTKRKLGININKCKYNRLLLKEILGLASTILLASIADQIFWKADQIILGKIYGTTLVAIYSVGAQIYNIYMQFGIQITGVYYPKMSALYNQNDGIQKVSDLFIEIGRVIFLILLLILSGFIIFGKNFLLFWVGKGYDAAYYVAIVVMIPFSIDLAQSIGLSILQITGQYGFRAKMYFLAALINIVSTIFMSIYLGMIGAALSTGLTMLVTSGFIMNWYFDKRVGLNIKKYWKKCFPIIIVAIALTIIGYLLNSVVLGDVNRFFSLIIRILVYAAAYFVVMFLSVMNQSEKSLVESILTRKS